MVSPGNPCYRNKIGLVINMQQEPQKNALADAAVPQPPASPEAYGDTPNPANEPEQVIRPEDEAVVVERLRELGYIE
jgi:hypothetical protein